MNMQPFYPAEFDRDYGCTEAEWLRALPGALGESSARIGPGRAQVAIGRGWLDLAWEIREPRVIALVRLPRLAVRFRFAGVDDPGRSAFMRRFDLYLLRGGG